jgi:hypothetical protein
MSWLTDTKIHTASIAGFTPAPRRSRDGSVRWCAAPEGCLLRLCLRPD